MALLESGCIRCNRFRGLPRQQMRRQNRLDQSRLGIALRLRCRLQILVGHAEIGVTQVVADRQLMFPQFGQHRSCRVAERVPAHPGDPNPLEGGPNLPLHDRSQIESFSTPVEPRREHEIRRLRAVTLRSPFQQSQLQCWMHGGEGLAEAPAFVLFRMPPRRQ